MTTPNTVGTYSATDTSTGLTYIFQITSQTQIGSTSDYLIQGTLTVPGFGTTGSASTGYAKFDAADPTAGYVGFSGTLSGTTIGTAACNGYCEAFGNSSAPLYLTVAAAKPLSGSAHDAIHVTLPFMKQ